MVKTKKVQATIDEDLHTKAKIGLFKLGMTWQEFLESYIKMKFGKERKNARQK